MRYTNKNKRWSKTFTVLFPSVEGKILSLLESVQHQPPQPNHEERKKKFVLIMSLLKMLKECHTWSN